MMLVLAADLVSSRLPFCVLRQLSHQGLFLTNAGSSADHLLGLNLRVRGEALSQQDELLRYSFSLFAAAFIEVLPHRDLFFVDADVNFL